MGQGYTKSKKTETFEPARRCFEHLVGTLNSQKNAKKEHGEIEELIFQDGMELLRTLFQSYLALCSEREPTHEAMTGSDGVVRNHHRHNCRHLETLFGRVKQRRKGYAGRGSDSLYPLDATLNFPPDLYSHGLRWRAARAIASGSYDDAVDELTRTTGGAIPKRQLEQLSMSMAQDFDGFYKQPERCRHTGADDLLVLSFDGKGIVMRTEDLREPTRRKAQKQLSTTRKKRLGRGEKRNRKRMATVAAVYGIAGQRRTIESVMTSSCDRPASAPPKPCNKRVWTSLELPMQEVIDEAFREALQRDPLRQRRWVALVDGNQSQLQSIKRCAKKYQVEVTIVLDFIHVVEYVWKAAYCLYAEGSTRAAEWVAKHVDMILRGKSGLSAGGMRRSATFRKLAAQDQKALDVSAGYLCNHKNYLHYDEYISDGLPIATGVIEGACRHLVKDRMDVTGARWSLKGAESVLKLRSLKLSGDLDDYFDFYTKCELKRNHLSKFENTLLFEVA